jgi:hypothetical protein
MWINKIVAAEAAVPVYWTSLLFFCAAEYYIIPLGTQTANLVRRGRAKTPFKTFNGKRQR